MNDVIMKKICSHFCLVFLIMSLSCNNQPPEQKGNGQSPIFQEGHFGYDLQFLLKQDPSLIVLKNRDAQLIASPKFQAKVFTSTSEGEKGLSFGWINYGAFGKVDAHMNAYGGENRLWLGPEGGRFSLFFTPDSPMIIQNWKTPAAFDTESWTILQQDSNSVTMSKEMSLLNYSGTQLELRVNRTIKILGTEEISERVGLTPMDSIRVVGYETDNTLINKGGKEWTAATGMPCIWLLDMLKPSPATVIVVPFRRTANEDFSKVATTNYFGEIPADRIKHTDSLLIFKADGKSRGKLGVTAHKALNVAGSYDSENKVLTIIFFEVDSGGRYLNQEWNMTKPPFSGDAVNAYNDGPLADGSQMGPFYEIESVSPAAFLKPDESLSHKQSVMHFTGDEKMLDKLAVRFLGLSLEEMNKTFSNEKTN
jgi:hypothetical protein